ncbi:MAG: glycoside hydrolase family 38 C-terminal domain-containing protein [bacterium]
MKLKIIFSLCVLSVLILIVSSSTLSEEEAKPAPADDILLFYAATTGADNAFVYYKISEHAYAVQYGDTLEYDLYISGYSAEPKGAVDIQFADDTNLRDSGSTDQQGLSAHPETNLNLAVDKWIHRTISLKKMVGKIAARWDVVSEGNRAGNYIIAVDNIIIKNKDRIRAQIYRDGAPPMSVVDWKENYETHELRFVKADELETEIAKFLTVEMILPELETAGTWIKGHPDQTKFEDIIADARGAVDLESCRTAQDEKCSASIKKAKEILAPLSALAKEYNLHYIGHAHIDMNWLWLWNETVQVAHDTFTSVLNLMKAYPDFKFSQSQASLYVAMEEKYPEIFSEIKKRVDEGRWELTGGSWVEGDLNMPSGEGIVRSILYSKRYFKEKFGKEIEVLWEPDTFGHAWTVPQIMRKSGLKYYYFCRCGKGIPLFWWEAPDGSRVLAYNHAWYNESIKTSDALVPRDIESKVGLKTGAVVYGVGDHGGGPTLADLHNGWSFKKEPLFPEVNFSTYKEFMESVLPYSDKLPVVRDELNFTFRGCYTTHADVKKANRRAESALPLAETASALATTLGRPYKHKDFEKAWRNVAFNQFHDIFDGSSIHDAYEFTHKLYDESFRIAHDETDGALGFIGRRIKADTTKGIAVMVFNPLAWERSDLIEVEAIFPQKPLAVRITDGKNETDAQILKTKETAGGTTTRLAFIASGVPSVGYKVFYLKSVSESGRSSISTGENFIENKFFRVEIDPDKGVVIRIYDKINNKEVVPTDAEANLFQMLLEAPTGMSAWDVGPILNTKDLNDKAEVSITESGSVRAAITVERKFRKSAFKQKIVLYDSIPRIDFPCEVEWKELGTAVNGSYMLKVAFPVNVPNGRAAFEIPFGSIERPANGEEVPALKWIDLSNDEYGVSLINDSKHGYDVKDNIMRLSLLRSSFYPDPRPDYGTHNFTYALYPHKGGWKDAQTTQKAYELNHPIAAYIIYKTLPNADLPESFSFLQIQPASLVVTAVKLSEDSDERFIIRFYDSDGNGGKGKIYFSGKVSGLKETDLLEREITPNRFKNKGDHYEFYYGKSEIITVSAEME